MATKWTWENAELITAIDGDTFTARLTRDIGFHGRAIFEQRLRLNRINAPKLNSPKGELAREALVAASVGPVTIRTIKPYKYGGVYMAEVTLPSGELLSDVMVATGHAVYWDGSGVRPADG